jgi:hypothetical protein
MNRATLRRLPSATDGASLVQYIVLVGVVGLAAMAGFRMFGGSVSSKSDDYGGRVLALNGTQGTTQAPMCTGGTCQGGSNCFAAGTLVATPDGLQPIETIHAGDLVWSEEETTGTVVAEHVLATFVTLDRDLLDVRLTGAAAPIRATPGHRFFTLDRGWVTTEELAPGEPLVDAEGHALAVERVDHEPERAAVYNFEVDETHTYFVGPDRVLVHNPMTTHAGQTGSTVDLNDPAHAAILILSDDPHTNAIKDTVTRLGAQYDGIPEISHTSLDPGSPTFDPQALDGKTDLILVTHGFPGGVVWGAGSTAEGIDGTTLAGRLQGAGYKPPASGAEIILVACNGGTSCGLFRPTPSVAQELSDVLGVPVTSSAANNSWQANIANGGMLGNLGNYLPGANSGTVQSAGGKTSTTQGPGDGRFQIGGAGPWRDPITLHSNSGNWTTCTPSP